MQKEFTCVITEMPRKSSSVYARKDATPAVTTTTIVQSKTLDALSEKLAGLTDTLAQTQKKVLEAKQTAAVVVASNSDLRKELDSVIVSSGDVKAANDLLKAQLDLQKSKKDRHFVFNHKGNEQQFDTNENIIDSLRNAKLAIKSGRTSEADQFIEEAIVALLLRNKFVKAADQHPAGWAIVREYLGTGLGVDEADEKKWKQAEASLEGKYKRKVDSGRGTRGKRSRGWGYYNGGQYHDSANSTQYYQLVDSDGSVSETSGTQYIQVPVYQASGGYIHQKKPAAQPRPPGPCFHCRGPHMVAHCPKLAELSADVRAKIEAAYFSK
jgi:hypothetical protein